MWRFPEGERTHRDGDSFAEGAHGAYGKRTLTAALQRKGSAAQPSWSSEELAGFAQQSAEASSQQSDPFWFAGSAGDCSTAAGSSSGAAAIQRRAEAGAPDGEAVHRAAALGTRDPAGPLPFLDVIQRAFGRHDVSGIEAHTGGAATAGARAMQASAFATGNHVAFGEAPSLHTAAHEAAHVVQQRAGVSLLGGVGAAGDPYEVHADRVAELVVAGQSAEALLDEYAGGGATDAATSATSTSATSASTQQQVQRAGAERAATGRPAGDAPYVDAPPGGPTSIGVTTGDVVRVRVTGNLAGGSVLKARVTAGGQFVQVGATAEALGGECTILNNTLFVKGLAANEAQAKSACEISILENDGEIQKLQPKVYDSLELPIHAWQVTFSAEEGDYEGIQICGEAMDMDRIITDVAATWRAAGIHVTLAATTQMHLQVDTSNPDVGVQVETALKADDRFAMDGRQIHLVFVPVYERFGLTFTRYSRKETDPTEMSTDKSRQKGFSSPMAIVGVNGEQKVKLEQDQDPAFSWTSRSRDTRAMDGEALETTQGDKDFHYQSVSSDTAHELGHILSLPHVSNAPAQSILNNPQSSYLFSQLMNAQVATPLCNLTGVQETDELRRTSAHDRLAASKHPRTQTGAMRGSTGPVSYNTQRGALITDQFAQLARQHLQSGKAFSQEREDEILEAELEALALALEHAFEEEALDGGGDGGVAAPAGPNEHVLRGRRYQPGARDLDRAVTEILTDGHVGDLGTFKPLVMEVLEETYDSVELLTAALVAVLPDGKGGLARELSGYIDENSEEDG